MIAVIPADGPLHLCLPAFVADEAGEAWSDAVVHRYDVPPPRKRGYRWWLPLPAPFRSAP